MHPTNRESYGKTHQHQYLPQHFDSANISLLSFTCTRCHNRVQRKQTLKRYDGIKSKSRAQDSFSTQATSSSASVATSVRDPIAEMFSSAEGTNNPFLTEDSDYWAKTSSSKCRVPNCNNDADQNHLTCEEHSKIISPKSIKTSDRPLISRHDSIQSNTSRPPPDAILASSRKNLEAKATARKTVSRRPFYSAGSRTNHHGQSSAAPILQKPVDHSPSSEFPARKKQRLISPGGDEHGPRNLTNACSPLALPSGFLYSKQNGEIPRPSRLPSLSNDMNAYPPGTAVGQEKPRTILSSYDDYLSSPLFTHPGIGPDTIKHNIASNNGPSFITGGTFVNADTFVPGEDADLNPGGVSRNLSMDTSASPDRIPFTLEPVGSLLFSGPLHRRDASEVESPARIRPQKIITKPMILRPASTRITPPKAKTGQGGIVNAPLSHLKGRLSTSIPLLEKQRQRLVEKQSMSNLDEYIYGQPSSSVPPIGLEIKAPPAPRHIPQDKGSFAYIDPRNHRSRPHSEQWYLQKEQEIRARGGRKVNFGKAAQRMKEQRVKEDPADFEASLPDRVRNNEDWVTATKWFQGRTVESNTAQPQTAALATPVRTKRKYTRRQPVAVAQPALDKKNIKSKAP